MNQCKFCKSWERGKALIENVRQSDGTCEKLNDHDAIAPPNKDVSAKGCFLLTDENFGCINFEKKEIIDDE